MEATTTTKVGSILIENGIVYKVYKVKAEKIQEKLEKIIYYKPYFAKISNNTLDCSIPESSLSSTNLRLPLTKSGVKELYSYLSVKIKRNKELDLQVASSLLSLNDIRKIAFVIKKYWKEKRKKRLEFTKVKRDMLEKAMDLISEEIAFVSNTTLDRTKEKITRVLNESFN